MALDGNPEVLQSDVVTLDPDSGAIDTVDVDIQSSSRTLSYSPDATRLAYDTRGRLMTLDLETGEQAQVGDGQTPSYGPNGDFVCVDGGRLWLQPADGSDAIPVARERASGDPERRGRTSGPPTPRTGWRSPTCATRTAPAPAGSRPRT